jgi:hypothetical protein|tara:strand:- start:14300 stop:14413 length:114 start_codon:yes stop_codon:yes gene_type:complete
MLYSDAFAAEVVGFVGRVADAEQKLGKGFGFACLLWC